MLTNFGNSQSSLYSLFSQTLSIKILFLRYSFSWFSWWNYALFTGSLMCLLGSFFVALPLCHEFILHRSIFLASLFLSNEAFKHQVIIYLPFIFSVIEGVFVSFFTICLPYKKSPATFWAITKNISCNYLLSSVNVVCSAQCALA